METKENKNENSQQVGHNIKDRNEKSVCENCGKKFDSIDALNQHKQAKHSLKQEKPGRKLSVLKKWII